MASTVFHLHVLTLDFCPYTCASRRLTLRKWWISWMTHRQIGIVHNGRFLPRAEKTRGGWPLSKLETVGDQLFCLQIYCTFPSYHIAWNLSFSFTWTKQLRNTVVTLSYFFWYLRPKLRPPSLNSFARELILSDMRHNDVTKYLCNDAIQYF